MIVLVLSVLIAFASAHEQQDCAPILPQFEDFENLHNAITKNFATETELSRASCLRRMPFTQIEIETWLAQNQAPARFNRTVNGVAFEHESEENLRAFELLTTATERFGERDTARNLVFRSNCKKVFCAVKSLFGVDVGMQLLFMQRRFGLNGSHIITPGSVPWSKRELDTALLGLSDVSKGVLPLAETKPFRRSKDRTQQNGSVVVAANSIIEVFDAWSASPPISARSIIVHEIGHALADITGLDETRQWKNMGGWLISTTMKRGEKQSIAVSSKPRTMVSQYGGTEPAEDFAESVKAFRYGPDRLLAASPEKYEYIRQTVFNGVEFRSEAHCENPETYSERMWRSAVKRYLNWTPTAQEMQRIVGYCQGRAIEAIYEDGHMSVESKQQQSCYRQAIQKFMKDSMATNRHLLPMVRNMPDIPLSEAQLRYFLRAAPGIQRQSLRNKFRAAFSTADHFNPMCRHKKLSRFSRAFSSSQGFAPEASANELHVIAARSCDNISENGSLRRLLPMDFGEHEIAEHVGNLIR